MCNRTRRVRCLDAGGHCDRGSSQRGNGRNDRGDLVGASRMPVVEKGLKLISALHERRGGRATGWYSRRNSGTRALVSAEVACAIRAQHVGHRRRIGKSAVDAQYPVVVSSNSSEMPTTLGPAAEQGAVTRNRRRPIVPPRGLPGHRRAIVQAGGCRCMRLPAGRGLRLVRNLRRAVCGPLCRTRPTGAGALAFTVEGGFRAGSGQGFR